MVKKIIRCANCHNTFPIPDPRGMDELILTCPVCKASLQLKLKRKSAPASASADADEGKTVIRENSRLKTPGKAVAKLQVKGSAETVQLEEGVNSVGRNKSTSNANIKLSGVSAYMSGHHMIIEIIPLRNGGLRADLRPWENLNSTKVNGVKLDKDDVFELLHGDKIEIADGQDVITFLLTKE